MILKRHHFFQTKTKNPGIFQKKTCAIVYKVANLTIDEMRLLARLRNVENHKSMSRPQLENIFATPSVPTAAPLPSPSPTKPVPTPILIPKKRSYGPRYKEPACHLISIDELERTKM